MKATLAMIACLAMAGFLTAAASVAGNNTAVVIQKDKVQASTGYQFLCVPVDGLAISGTTGSGIDISTFLPPETCTENTEVTVLNLNGTKPMYYTFKVAVTSDTDSTLVWKKNTAEGSATDGVKDDGTLKPGAILWVLDGTNTSVVSLAETSEEASTPAAPITFCGQSRTRTETGRPNGTKMTAMKNDGATPITLSSVIKAPDKPQTGDQILRVQNNVNDYQRYWYEANHWWIDGEEGSENADNVTIQPGESFYYYSKKAI